MEFLPRVVFRKIQTCLRRTRTRWCEFQSGLCANQLCASARAHGACVQSVIQHKFRWDGQTNLDDQPRNCVVGNVVSLVARFCNTPRHLRHVRHGLDASARSLSDMGDSVGASG